MIPARSVGNFVSLLFIKNFAPNREEVVYFFQFLLYLRVHCFCVGPGEIPYGAPHFAESLNLALLAPLLMSHEGADDPVLPIA